MSLAENMQEYGWDRKRIQKKRAEMLLLEIQDLGLQPPRMVKANAPSMVVACVIQEACWPAYICPVMKAVINVDPEWGKLSSKGKCQPGRTCDPWQDVVMAEAMNGEEGAQ